MTPVEIYRLGWIIRLFVYFCCCLIILFMLLVSANLIWEIAWFKAYNSELSDGSKASSQPKTFRLSKLETTHLLSLKKMRERKRTPDYLSLCAGELNLAHNLKNIFIARWFLLSIFLTRFLLLFLKYKVNIIFKIDKL